MTQKSKNRFAFTLIELLVVIAIIGLLSTIAVASLSTSRKKARDAIRKHDLEQIQTAIKLYMDKNNQNVPPDNCWEDYSRGGNGSSCEPPEWTGDWHSNSGLRVLVSENFFSKLPVDPTNDTTHYYKYEPQSGSYCIHVRLESGVRFGYIGGTPCSGGECDNIPVGYQCTLDEYYQ